MTNKLALFRKTVTIEAGESFSSYVDLGFGRTQDESIDTDDKSYRITEEARCVGVSVPAALPDAANLTLQANFLEPDDADFDSAWEDVYDSNDSECTIKLTSLPAQARKRYVPFFPAALLSVPCIRLRSGNAGSPVVQTSAVSFVLTFRTVV